MRYRNPAVFIVALIVLFSHRTLSQPPASSNLRPVFITAAELRDKTAGNQRVVIIDVRATSGYVGSNQKIKGAIHVKLRRLKSRLQFAPLKDISRDTEVVTYCACEEDQASIRAAQILSEAGFKRVRVLQGGWQAWRKIDGPVELRPQP